MNRISIDEIQKVVAEYFDQTVELIHSKTRKREIVQSRQIAMFFSKKLTKYSLAEIGKEIGGKDHATVLHACKTVNNLIDTDKRFNNYIKELEETLKVGISGYSYRLLIGEKQLLNHNVREDDLIELFNNPDYPNEYIKCEIYYEGKPVRVPWGKRIITAYFMLSDYSDKEKI